MSRQLSNVRRYELENTIKQLIKNDNNCTAHFEWNFTPPGLKADYPFVQLDLITYNPKHKTTFLLHSIKEERIPDNHCFIIVLEKMLAYIQKRTTTILNYNVEWNYRFADNEKQEPIKSSYFRGRNVQEILEKLYFNKEKDTIVIYKIEMIAES